TQHHGDAVGGVAIELRAQVRADDGRAPPELDDVDALAHHLEQTVDLGDREPPVDHVGDPLLTGLGRALRDVEEAGYGVVVPWAALSAPTTTTTFAGPASVATACSIGCTWVTESEWATPFASAWWPGAYCTTVTSLAPGGRP